MKRAWRVFLMLIAVMALLTCAAFAAEETVGDVTFTYSEYNGSVTIYGITIAESVDGPVDVVIPSTIAGMPVRELDLQGMTPETAAKIKTLTFTGDVPMIHGNLFRWKYENMGLDIESNGYRFASDCYFPDTNTLLVNIPAFVTGNYNYDSNGDGTNDTYYAGDNLVRVDAGYSGDLTVKDGTVSILAGAMEGCANLGTVTLPDSVEWIGVRAFANSGVTSVNLPAGLLTKGSKTIQMQTFFGCTNLQAVTFPEGTDKLTKVGYQAFYHCSSLTGFDFARAATLDTLSFAKAFAAGTAIDLSQTSINYTAAIFSHSGVGSVTFGTATGGTIPFEAFYKCASLTQVDGMETISAIYAWAFSDCTSLAQDMLADCTEKSLYLGNAYRAFANTAMTEITFPATVTSMTGSIFSDNEQLEIVNWYAPSISSSLFSILNNGSSYCWTQYTMPGESYGEGFTAPKTLNLYALPSGMNPQTGFFEQPCLETVNFMCEITAIPDGAFQFCPNLKEVTFQYPEKITSIGFHAFGGCLSLKSFPFTEMTELTSIANGAFMLVNNSTWYTPATYDALSEAQKTYGLTEIDLAQCTKLNRIGEAAFYNQYSVTSLHLPDGCSPSSRGIFNGTVSMTELICDGDLANNLIANTMMTSTSGYNDNLETVTVKGQLVYGGSPIFFGMDALKTVNLPEATSIPEQCFLNCTALETVNAPKVETVKNYAFFNSGLKETVISGGVSYGDYVFMNSKLEKVVVEEGVTELGDFMFEGCTALEQVSLPSTLETINWAAFKNTNASTIEIPASVTLVEDDAFCSGSFSLIFRGTPLVELTHRTSLSGINNLLPINCDATIYYTNDDAKAAAEVYAASLPEGVSAPAIAALPAKLELVITGTPTSVTAGEALDLTNLKVTYNGTELTSDQYSLDYDAADAAAGSRAVTLTVTDNTLPANLKESAISARGFSSEPVSGKVYTVGNADGCTGTFTVEVIPNEPTPTYPPTVEQPDEGGSVTVSPSDPAEDAKVTITPQPDEGYAVKDVIVTDQNGDPVAVTDNGDGTYSFTQPAGKVTIRVVFKDTAVPFVDVPANAYYYDAVQWAVGSEITNGTSSATFSPNAKCTRAQAVTFLWRAAGCPSPTSSEMPFKDVVKGSYYETAVLWAVENGITNGTSATAFSPDARCTRAQIVTFLWRYQGKPAAGTANPFTDVAKNAYYTNAVLWAAENGITLGTSASAFSPQENCTRAQTVTFLYRCMGK